MLKNYVKLIVTLVFASNVMAQNVPSYVPTNGLVGYWPFNGNANDESGNGNNGTVNGATLAADRNGKANSAYSFDGVSNYITISKSVTSLIVNSYSISFWILTSDTSLQNDGHEVIGDRDITTFDFKFRLNYGIKQQAFLQNTYIQTCTNSNNICSTINTPLPTLYKWEHYFMTFDSITNTFKAYKNGSLLQKNDNVTFSVGNRQINIGRSVNPANVNGNAYYKGLFDDLTIYNRALTEQEITALYTATPVAQNIPSYVPTNGLVGYWPFNGNANDESVNGNDGTVNGATLTIDRNGVANSAYSFDGNDVITSKPKNLSIGNNQRAISVWMNTNKIKTGGPLVEYGSSEILKRFGLLVLNNNKEYCYPFVACQFNDIDVNTNLSDDNWINIIVNYKSNIFEVYVNGKLEIKATNFNMYSNNNVNTINTPNSDLLFGKSVGAEFFNGYLDDIAIYNRALTEQEITALYSGTPATGLASTKVFVDAPATVNQNQEVELSISTEALNTADNVIAYQTDFSYDTTRFTYLGSNLVGTLNPAGTVGINKSKNGLLQVGYMSQTALSGAGSLVKLKFKANNTTGQGIFGLANFMYNNTTITSLKSDTVTTLDVTPPTAKITYTQNPVRKGDSLLITVNFNEKMAVSPVPQLNLTGQNTLSNTNLTKVNDTTYTFWWVVEKGNGAVNVTLATGKDLGGNAIVATPTQNPTFTVLPTLFGDVDTNSFVRAYDAALALQYSVGLNPLPTMDPLPWSNWRIAVANVDTVGNVTANDASLILQKSIGQIATFPADAKKRGGETPTANVTVTQEGNQLVFRATGSLYAFNVYMKDNFNVFGQPEVKDKSALVASNITTTTYKVGLAATTPLVENEPFLVIPILTNENLQGTLDIVANAQERSLSYGKAAGLTTINQEAVIVYPNPTKDVVTIINAHGKTLRIVDVQGKEVYNQKVNTSSMEVSMKALGAKGMYLLHIVDANNESIQTKQIVLE